MKPCKVCHIAMMEPHPELLWWSKCPTCGYSEIPYYSMTKEDRKKAEKNPHAMRAHIILQRRLPPNTEKN